MKTLIDRFYAKVMMCPMSGCWLWTASLNDHGYGRMGIGSAIDRAHRVAWNLFRGKIPEGVCVLHRCDVRSCVNPSHLFLGTRAENMSDKIAKGRQLRGEKIKTSKLDTKSVKEIRLLLEGGLSQRTIAKLYGVCQQTIAHIAIGGTWRHV